MRIFLPRLSQATIVALALGVLSLNPLSAIASIAPSQRAKEKADPPAIQTWELATGGTVEASIVGYSLQNRIITLQNKEGSTAHIAPRDLTALSKLKWLTSPVFITTIRGYQPPKVASLTVASALVSPALGTLLGAFLAFWFSVSMVNGQKMLRRATITFSICVLYVIIIGASAAFMLRGISIGLGDSPVAPMIHSAVLVGSVVALIAIISNRIGGDYGTSGGSGFGIVMVGLGIGLIMATVTLYVLPRTLEQPGLDEWFTDRLLMPLGLA